ncbi:MAG: lipopolysaccharide biosynthesis protein [Robiginitomaculum sp.]|nr:lipopolysaccharide biosynthesis protein [Robiginitomaculum sp.]
MNEELNHDLGIAEKGTVGRRVAANTGLMVGAKALAAMIGLITLVITTQTLPIAAVGIIMFLHAYMLFFAEVATFQSWQAVIRFGTHDVEAGNTNALGRLLRFCIALDFVGAMVAFVLAIGGLYFLDVILPLLPSFQQQDGLFDTHRLTEYGILYCLLVLVHQGGASTGLFRLFDKFKPLAVQVLVMPIVRLGGVILAALYGASLEGFLFAWFVGSLLGYLSLPLLAILELKSRNLLKTVFSAWPRLKTRHEGMWPFVWKANIDASLATGTTHLPLLLVMPIFGPAFVGAYKVAEEIARLLSEAVLLLDRVIYPEYARMMARGQSAHIWRIVIKAGAVMLGGGLALSAIVALIGPYLIPAVFGLDYIDAVPLSILLVLAAALMGVAAPLYPVFFAAGNPGRAIFARLAGLVLYVVLVFALSAWLGTTGIGKTGPGWAAIGGNLLAVILAAWLAKRTLKAKHD